MMGHDIFAPPTWVIVTRYFVPQSVSFSVVVIDEFVTSGWQSLVSAWLVKSGCLYMMAWGKGSSTWDDSVDFANLEENNYADIPEEKFVISTWHENELLKDVFWFSKNNAFHPTVELLNTLILHISRKNREMNCCQSTPVRNKPINSDCLWRDRFSIFFRLFWVFTNSIIRWK